jgi:hypothetical protein
VLEDGSAPSEFLGYSARIELTTVVAMARPDNEIIVEISTREEGRLCHYKVTDHILDVSQWSRFGRLLRNSISLVELQIRHRTDHQTKKKFVRVAGQCLTVAFAEAKHNESIGYARLNLTLGLSINDLSYFIRNNGRLSDLKLEHGGKGMTLENSTVLSGAISSVPLRKLDIKNCRFEPQHESFQQLLGGCSNLEKLSATCAFTSDCNSLTAFLRDPSNELKYLHITFCGLRSDQDISVEQHVRDITISLKKHTHLKKLKLSDLLDEYKPCFDSDNLLCDISSIDSILSNSNHTIQHLDLNEIGYPFITLQCLEINSNEDKDEVKREKIFSFYFVGKFDVSPFLLMPVSILPKVMSQIVETNKLSAMYHLLRCIPALCNVSDSESTGNKRQKIRDDI